MRRNADNELNEVEALVYRLFAEKQFAMALPALVMVANLVSAQFLLLRVAAPMTQATEAPSPNERLDVRCEGGELRGLDGEALPTEGLSGREVVLHLDPTTSRCLAGPELDQALAVVLGVGAP